MVPRVTDDHIGKEGIDEPNSLTTISGEKKTKKLLPATTDQHIRHLDTKEEKGRFSFISKKVADEKIGFTIKLSNNKVLWMHDA